MAEKVLNPSEQDCMCITFICVLKIMVYCGYDTVKN